MNRSPPPSPEVRALLDRERVVPPLPAHARERSLARARAALIARRLTPPSGFGAAPRTRWGSAVALTCIVSAAVGATAYEIGAHRRPVASDGSMAPMVHVVAKAQRPAMPAPTLAAPPASTPAPTSNGPRSTQADPGPAELRLLRQARSAVVRQDFAAALVPIAEHGRRFKHGRLAEEREALRVKALSGLGRREEARRAADAFESRFPRSVLLPAVEQMPASGR
jgi:hypothetical protein